MSDDKHIKELTKHKSHKPGCVTKHEEDLKPGDQCSYRNSGLEEAKSGTSDKGRTKSKYYNWDFTVAANAARLPTKIAAEHKLGFKKTRKTSRKDPRTDKKAWWLLGTNFTNAYTPYNHNHHHIMPWTCLNSKLSPAELKILQAGQYNLNDKDNLILLPCGSSYGIALMLPDHPYAHAAYNRDVKTIVNKLKEATNTAKPHKIKPANVTDFKDRLVKWQRKQYDKIVDHGEQNAKKFLAGRFVPPNQINTCPVK